MYLLLFPMADSYDIEQELLNWDVKAQQQRADFMDFLYETYNPGTGLYSGLWERFKTELAESAQKNFARHGDRKMILGHNGEYSVPLM